MQAFSGVSLSSSNLCCRQDGFVLYTSAPYYSPSHYIDRYRTLLAGSSIKLYCTVLYCTVYSIPSSIYSASGITKIPIKSNSQTSTFIWILLKPTTRQINGCRIVLRAHTTQMGKLYLVSPIIIWRRGCMTCKRHLLLGSLRVSETEGKPSAFSAKWIQARKKGI